MEVEYRVNGRARYVSKVETRHPLYVKVCSFKNGPVLSGLDLADDEWALLADVVDMVRDAAPKAIGSASVIVLAVLMAIQSKPGSSSSVAAVETLHAEIDELK